MALEPAPPKLPPSFAGGFLSPQTSTSRVADEPAHHLENDDERGPHERGPHANVFHPARLVYTVRARCAHDRRCALRIGFVARCSHHEWPRSPHPDRGLLGTWKGGRRDHRGDYDLRF